MGMGASVSGIGRGMRAGEARRVQHQPGGKSAGETVRTLPGTTVSSPARTFFHAPSPPCPHLVVGVVEAAAQQHHHARPQRGHRHAELGERGDGRRAHLGGG